MKLLTSIILASVTVAPQLPMPPNCDDEQVRNKLQFEANEMIAQAKLQTGIIGAAMIMWVDFEGFRPREPADEEIARRECEVAFTIHAKFPKGSDFRLDIHETRSDSLWYTVQTLKSNGEFIVDVEGIRSELVQ